MDKIEIAREVLRELHVVSKQLDWDNGGKSFYFNLDPDIDEDLIINAMLVFLDRINNK